MYLQRFTNSRWIVAAAVSVVLMLTGCSSVYGLRESEKPDFSGIQSVEARKSAFFDYLLPYVDARNREILQTRRELLSWRDKGPGLSAREREKLRNIAREYEVTGFDETRDDHWAVLLRRVDIVPPSLALAQAANESAWGTSRFASEGSNFFGLWCFEPGCGIVPRERPEDATYEVAQFRSARESVDRYMHNLNHHPAYQELRVIRERMREAGKTLSGMTLAGGLEKYSARGEQYVDMIRVIISANDLGKLDTRV